MKKPAGIQIIGTQRSGSNLLRVILDQSEDIASPPPPHILTTFVPLLPLYGPLDQAAYRALISDVVDFVNANPVPWEGIFADKEQLFRQSEVFSLFELNKLIYQQAALTKGSKYWCCKSMGNVYYATELEKVQPDLKYIFLYRDGRDVAVSFKKAVVGEKHTYFLAKQWKQDQDACLELASRLDSSRFFALNYESLITHPGQIVQKLCNFLEISYSEDMLQFYRSNTSRITAAAGEMWSNLERPIISNNTGKFLKDFKDTDLELFELIAGDTLKRLGYALHTSMTSSNLVSEEMIKKYTIENALLRKEILSSAKKSDLERREPQLAILHAIKNRNAQNPQI
ncbi:sulfotransferase family protein [Arcticibacter tournemirensis]|uniref:Sulfotransferase n=1 Tax=Arcticibacter tournemirensis TaxID=699437 RepID=A0A5M9HIY3_9SPHI|nr:sulfotransferase [Arcticibacter tournemirensis]KAA8484957.1 sulfotransferase [Arcticibacter tournemirensis]TQM50602.1 sulfotransferase family protein [Arcticibacter tournemirensis]